MTTYHVLLTTYYLLPMKVALCFNGSMFKVGEALGWLPAEFEELKKDELIMLHEDSEFLSVALKKLKARVDTGVLKPAAQAAQPAAQAAQPAAQAARPAAQAAQPVPPKPLNLQTTLYVGSLGGKVIRLRNPFWRREYLYACAGDGPNGAKKTRWVVTSKDLKEPTSTKKDWRVELVPGTTDQIRLRSMHWNQEYMYGSDDPALVSGNTYAVLTHRTAGEPVSNKKDWKVELVAGTTNQVRLKNVYLDRYLWATGAANAKDDGKPTRPVRLHTDSREPTSNKKDWEIEFG